MALTFSRQRQAQPAEASARSASRSTRPTPAGTPRFLQRKALEVAAETSSLEREADAVAEQILRMPDGAAPAGIAGAAGVNGGAAGDGRADSANGHPALPKPGPAVSAGLGGGGSPLPEATRAFFEPRLGANLSSVRVHTGTAAGAAASEIRAKAFTHGQNIYFGRSRFVPESREGRRLLAHELVHTVQQASGTSGLVQADLVTTRSEMGPAEAESSLPARPSRPPHEILLVSGGPTSNREDREHDTAWYNYATAARIRIERLMESAFGDQRQMIPTDRISWVVVRPPYRYRAIEDGAAPDTYIDLLSNESLPKLQASWDRLLGLWLVQHPEDAGLVPFGAEAIRLHFIDTAAEAIDVINQGALGGGRQAVSFEDRGAVALPVGRFEYFGHGKPGVLWFQMGWEHIGRADETLTTDDLSAIDPNAFVSEAEYRSWSCNTATPPGKKKASFAEAWVRRFGGRFVGARGRTTYEFIMEGGVELSREEPARWQTIAAVGPTPASTAPASRPTPSSEPAAAEQPGWVHESQLPPSPAVGIAPMPLAEDLRPIAERARAAAEEALEPKPVAQRCDLEIVPLGEPADPGDLVCSEDGAGRFNVASCEPVLGPGTRAAAPAPLEPLSDVKGPGPGYYRVDEIDLYEIGNEVAPDSDDPAWQPFLQEIANRAYAETFDVDSAPGTAYNLAKIGSAARARSRGFYIGVVHRNGRIYYKIYGQRGAHSGIPGRWYAAHNLPNTRPALHQMVSPRAGLGAGLRSGSIGIGGALTVAGTTLDYAIDPKKEFGTDYGVDIALDLVKSAGASAAGGAAAAATTSILAGGALGATIGSAAPVVGTVIGFVVGVLAAMAIEYFIGDLRASLKAWLRSRRDIRGRRSEVGEEK